VSRIEKVNQMASVEEVDLEQAQHLLERDAQGGLEPQEGQDQIRDQCYPHLGHHGVLGGSQEGLDLQVLFHRFEEQLDVIVATHKTIDLVFHTQVYKLKREMTRKHLASASSVSFRQNDVLEVNDESPAHSPATDCGRSASVGALAHGAQDHSGTPGGPGCK
jgi:hypothetical protein